MLDATSRSLQYALDGLTMRQTVLSDNIANEGTPGYQAKAVDFESAMTDALDSSTVPSRSRPSPAPEPLPSPTATTSTSVTPWSACRRRR